MRAASVQETSLIASLHFTSSTSLPLYPDTDTIATMQNDTINQMFSKEYTSISEVYNASTEDDVLALKGCVLRARSLLEEPKIPRYYRIKTLLLLASTVADPEEA
jgi:hypothetical protein